MTDLGLIELSVQNYIFPTDLSVQNYIFPTDLLA